MIRSRRRKLPVVAMAFALACVSLPALVLSACSTDGEPNTFDAQASGSGASSGTGATGGEGGGIGLDPDPTLEITPVNPTLKVAVPLAGQTVQFVCTDSSTGLPAQVTWSLSSIETGTIDANGLFTPNGAHTGDTWVTCQGATSKAETKLTVVISARDNPNGVTQAEKDLLQGPPGKSDPTWEFLYPYDKTVFPKGIPAPEIHLSAGSAPGAVYYVNILAPSYEYKGFFNATASQTQLKMSQPAWDALANAAAGQTVEVHVSKLNAANEKVGPIYRTWTIANGKLHGTIYYNTYDSSLAGQTGAMMRIKGNSVMPEVLAQMNGQCTVCHSVSADGSTAAASTEPYPGWTFDLTGGQVNPPVIWTSPTESKTAFAALYPKNGEVFVVNGAPPFCEIQRVDGVWTSELRTKSGTLIENTGIEGLYAQTPVFSHDGNHVAFYDRAPNGSWGNCPGTLAMMDYDAVTQKFSNYQVLATPPPGRHYGWPAFTPDSKWVIYQNGVGDNLQTTGGNTGKLIAVHTVTKEKVLLSILNGDGYMPRGIRDEDKNYEPSTTPIASGGYFWVIFTSRRTYGNALTGPAESTKRLWVAALDPNAPQGVDPSHPAFYITGQELTSGNSRGFWALDPCKQDGLSCESGDECCNGFCNPIGDPPEFLCGPPDGECSGEFESCTTTADCCENRGLECIGGVCSTLPPD
jgi:hypothetical protein